MQMSKRVKLLEAWEKKGDPPCDHPSIDREYTGSSHTGDWVCTICGHIVDENKKPEKKD